MSDQKIVQKIVLAGIILYKKKVLILQRNGNEDIFPGIWELPSGKKKPLEIPLKALLREVKEETGLDVKMIMPTSFFSYQIKKNNEIWDSVQINCLVKPINKKNKVRLSSEHQKFVWVGTKNISNYKLSNLTKKAIKQVFALI